MFILICLFHWVIIEAKRRQVPVMAHAHGADGIVMAAECGCRSIEHASFIDDRGIAACISNNTWIVPTFTIGVYFEEQGSATGAQDRMISILKATDEEYQNCIRAAVDAGVKVALGSDYVGWKDASLTAREFQYLVERAHMSPLAAIQAGTSSAADMLCVGNIGRIKIGCVADIVVINGNPLEDITALRTHLCFVMKGGKVVRRDTL